MFCLSPLAPTLWSMQSFISYVYDIMLDRATAWTTSLLILLLFIASADVHAQDKQPLDHDVYSIWNQMHTSSISDDGDHVLYVLGPENEDDTLRVDRADGSHVLDVPRGGVDAQFTASDRHVIARINPPEDEENDDPPADSLAVVDLDAEDVMRIPEIQSYALPEENGTWLAYRHADVDDAEENGEGNGNDENDNNGNGERPDAGNPLTLYNLDTGDETTFEHATSHFEFTDDGDWLVYAAATPDSTDDGVYAVDTETGEQTPMLTGPGSYEELTLDEDGTQAAFLTNRDDVDADEPEYTLYRGDLGAEATLVADQTTDGVPEDWWVSEHGSVSFSDDGTRLFFGTRPTPREDTTATLRGEEVEVDVWHWEDPRPQPAQLEQRDQELQRTYQAVAHLDEDERVVQLAREEIPDVTVGDNGNADVAVANTNRPYRKQMSWDFPTYYDIYLIDVTTGEERLIKEEFQSPGQLSPDADYVMWWNLYESEWYAQSTEPGSEPINLTEAVPHSLSNHMHDRPYPAPPYGAAGWTEDDAQFLVYDQYDVWAIDPEAPEDAYAVTGETGRDQNLTFRHVDLDDDDAIDPDEAQLFHTFDNETKAAGYHRGDLGGGALDELVMMDRHFSGLQKAEDADRLLFQREDVQEFPDLWTADLDFDGMQRVSHANPQQDNYRWATAELMSWTSLVGEDLDGILYKPEDFDPDEEYPMMVYFYNRHSDGLHQHEPQRPHRSVINRTFYASRGYVVFVPDVVYEEGYPGQSAYNSIMPAVTQLADRSYIDGDRVGIQGHSWAGYQISYLVTRTDFFAAAAPGAPVSNMTSAYGGIRWGSGRSRQFQYERTQSRIGGSLWEYPMRYWENSPLFEADRITTPLLIMHNDDETAVPWEQGIELFMALRRLDRPAWLINYNDQPHWPVEYHLMVDWQMRMQQFFDHFLMDEPAPQWIEEGIPATEKGRTLGYELDEDSNDE